MVIAEAIRTAQQLTGKKLVNADDVRRGFESLNITAARMKELGLEGFAAPVSFRLRRSQWAWGHLSGRMGRGEVAYHGDLD